MLSNVHCLKSALLLKYMDDDKCLIVSLHILRLHFIILQSKNWEVCQEAAICLLLMTSKGKTA